MDGWELFPQNVTEWLTQMITSLASLSKHFTKDALRYFPDLLHTCTRQVVDLYLLLSHPQHRERDRDEPLIRKATMVFLHRMVECLRDEVLQYLPGVLDRMLRSAVVSGNSASAATGNPKIPRSAGGTSETPDLIPVLQLINQTILSLGPLTAPMIQNLWPSVLQQSVTCLQRWDYIEEWDGQFPAGGPPGTPVQRITPGVALQHQDPSRNAPAAVGEPDIALQEIHPYSAAISERADVQKVLLQFVNTLAQPGLVHVLGAPESNLPHCRDLLSLLLRLAVHTTTPQQSTGGGGGGSPLKFEEGGAGSPPPPPPQTGNVGVSKSALQVLGSLLESWLDPEAWHTPFLQRQRAIFVQLEKRKKSAAAAAASAGGDDGPEKRSPPPTPQFKVLLRIAEIVKRNTEAAQTWQARNPRGSGQFTGIAGHPCAPPLDLLRNLLPVLVPRLLQHLLHPRFQVSDSEYRSSLGGIAKILIALSAGFGEGMLSGVQNLLRGRIPDSELGKILDALRARKHLALRQALLELKKQQQQQLQQNR